MRNILSVITVICFTFILNAEAQITKGKILLGISSGINYPGEVSSGTDPFSFNFITTQTISNVFYRDPVKSTTINLQPFAGYCIYDHLILGLKFSYRYNFRERDLINPWDSYDIKMTIFMGGPFIRFYLPVKKIHPFITGNFAYGIRNDRNIAGSYTYSDKYLLSSLGGGIGISISLCEKASFD